LPEYRTTAIFMEGEPVRKRLHFVGSSRKDLKRMPEQVQDVFGAALLDAQYGDRPEGARPFGEGLPRAVMKIVADFNGDTYRVAYTVKLPKAVYVLHVLKKKSKSGVATPKADRDRIRTRLRAAEAHHRRVYEGGS
jgi:phage-related protein